MIKLPRITGKRLIELLTARGFDVPRWRRGSASAPSLGGSAAHRPASGS
jgi:hypothetical protein